MPESVPDTLPVYAGKIGQGLPSAGIHDAPGTALNPVIQTSPQWARQATHRVLRVPGIKYPGHLIEGAFDNTTIVGAPDSQTLVDTITLSVLAGRTDRKSARHMANLRHTPIALWKATETQLGALAKDSEQHINNWFRTTLTERFPLKASVQFIVAWHNEYPLAVPPSLIERLQQLVKANARAIGIINEAENELSQAAAMIASELNDMLTIEPTLKEQTNIFCGIGFVPYRDDEALIRIEPDIMQMHLLPSVRPEPGINEDAAAYEKALSMAIVLLSEHYLPLATPDDVAETSIMFFEEAEDDIHMIHAFMDKADMDKKDDAQVADAINALLEGDEDAGGLFFIEDIDSYQFHRDFFNEKEVAEREWTPIKAVASPEELATRIEALPNTDDETLLRLRHWLTALANDLKQRLRDPKHTPWHETLADITHPDNLPFYVLIERNMLLTNNYTALYAEAEQRHQFQMEDDGAEGPIRLTPDANPKTVLRFCQQMREGTEWLTRLHLALDSDAPA